MLTPSVEGSDVWATLWRKDKGTVKYVSL